MPTNKPRVTITMTEQEPAGMKSIGRKNKKSPGAKTIEQSEKTVEQKKGCFL